MCYFNEVPKFKIKMRSTKQAVEKVEKDLAIKTIIPNNVSFSEFYNQRGFEKLDVEKNSVLIRQQKEKICAKKLEIEKNFSREIKCIPHTQNYRFFNCLDDFTPQAIFDNINSFSIGTGSKIIPSYLFSDAINKKFEAYKELIVFLHFCREGNSEALLILHKERTEFEDDFYAGQLLDIKIKMFEFAVKEGFFKESSYAVKMTIQSFIEYSNYYNKTANKKPLLEELQEDKIDVPGNVFVSEKATRFDLDSYKNFTELSVIIKVASLNPMYKFHAMCDTSKEAAIYYLISQGYTQIKPHKQVSPDLLIIDFSKKVFRFLDVKHCNIFNFKRKFENFSIIELGGVSFSEKIELQQVYFKMRLRNITKIIDDPFVSVEVKKDAQAQLDKNPNSNVDAIKADYSIIPNLINIEEVD